MGRIIFLRGSGNYIAIVHTLEDIKRHMKGQRAMVDYSGYYCEYREDRNDLDGKFIQVKLQELRQLLSKN